MDMINKSWKAVSAWWAKLPKQKWIALGFVAIMLMAAASKVLSQEEGIENSTLWVGTESGAMIGCNPRLNADGIHICASANTGQRGYCIPIPDGRFADTEVGGYYCAGNQPGNKTYDKALLIRTMVDDTSKSLADIDAMIEAWDVQYPPQLALPGG